MPTGVRKAPSVAPAVSTGITGTPGQILAASALMGSMIGGVSGGGTLAIGLRALAMVTVTFGSPTSCTRTSRTCSGVVPGKIRQLMFAVARWGRGVVAWPPAIIVATQVVCSMPLYAG